MKNSRKPAKSTKSQRRFTYKSFRESLDTLSITGSTRSLTNSRLRYEVDDDSFHYNESINHWKELNISKNFTEYCRETYTFTNSLAQLIHHRKTVFQILVSYIDKHDNLSLEPLLDLLVNFTHDMGAEYFMDMYEEAMVCLTKLALHISSIGENSTTTNKSMSNDNVIQWDFTAIAFIFKHLSKDLAKEDGLRITLKVFYPCLILVKRQYISRFAAEAISFLFKKSNDAAISVVVEFFKEKLQADDDLNDQEKAAFQQSMVILFSESVKNVSNAYHTKPLNIVLKLLMNNALEPVMCNVYCDVVISMLAHGTAENVVPIYEITIGYLENYPSYNNPESFSCAFQILSTLLFAESGRKTPSWDSLVSIASHLIKKLEDQKFSTPSTFSVVSYFFVLFIRNAPMEVLAKSHRFIFDSMLTLDNGRWFMGFVEAAISIQREKTLIFGSKIISDYIIKHWKTHEREIACFITRIPSEILAGGAGGGNKLSLSITAEFYQDLIKGLQELTNKKSKDDHQTLEIYWRLLILQHSKNFKDYQVFLELFLKTFSASSSGFTIEICGAILTSLAKQQVSDKDSLKIIETIVEGITYTTLEPAQLMEDNNALKSATFIDGIYNFLLGLDQSSNSATIRYITDRKSLLINSLSNCLVGSSHDLRAAALSSISVLMVKSGEPVSDLLNRVQGLENVELNLKNGRDLLLRSRQLGSALSTAPTTDRKIAVKWSLGYLNSRFKPAWDAILEIIGQFVAIEEEELWETIHYFIFKKYDVTNGFFKSDQSELAYSDEIIFDDWNVLSYRLADSYTKFRESFGNYGNLDRHLVEYAKQQRTEEDSSSFMRYQALQVLLKIPQLGEKKARFLVPVVLSEDADSEDDDEQENDDESKINDNSFSDWTTKDKNLMIELFGKFKNIKNIHRSSEVYNHGLNLLCSKSAVTQKAALKVVLAFKVDGIRKYTDNLNNIIDDSTFKDEIVTFFSSNRAEDLSTVVGVILRILYGKAKVRSGSGSKQGKKNAVLKLLGSLNENYVDQFLRLGYDDLKYPVIFEEYQHNASTEVFGKVKVTERLVRKLLGFMNLLGDVITELKARFPRALEGTLNPLIYAIGTAQYAVDHQPEKIVEKYSKQVRQMGLRNLSRMFNIFGSGDVTTEEEDEEEDEEDNTIKVDYTLDWDTYIGVIYNLIVKPRLEHFANENLQSPSAIMKMLCSCAQSTELHKLLVVDHQSPAVAILQLFENAHCKSSVLMEILDFATNVVNSDDTSDEWAKVGDAVIASCSTTLPQILSRPETSKEVVSKVVRLILLFIERDLISKDTQVLKLLVDTLINALDKSNSENYFSLTVATKTDILTAICGLLVKLNITQYEDVKTIYEIVARSFKMYADIGLRDALVNIVCAIGNHLEHFVVVGDLLRGLNANNTSRMGEPDFEKRMEAFAKLNEVEYSQLDAVQWLPLVHACLFFINDEEFSIRSSARYSLSRFIDGTSLKKDETQAAPYDHVLKDVILPNLRVGIRKDNDRIQKEYVLLLAHVVEHSKYYTDLADMKVLLFDNDDEANFFLNVGHIQIHRRQRAVRRLGNFAPQITPSNISHYLIPIVERFVYCETTENSNARNLSNDAIESIGILVRYINWNQYKALMKRFVSYLKNKVNYFRDVVHLVVSTCTALKISIKNRDVVMEIDSEEVDHDKAVIKGLCKDQNEIDNFILKSLLPQLNEVLGIRDEDTAVVRVSISESIVSLILCLSEQQQTTELPGVLTKVAQILRTRSEELRDSVRKSLGKIAVTLGTKYLPFVIRELKGALRRGPQIHILSFTVHYLLVMLNGMVEMGELDDCSGMIMDIIMEDLFGAAAQEKEAEGYSSKTKEVKHNKSYDTAEILASYINLSQFNSMLQPIKLLIGEQISLKTQTRLDELLRRFTLGLNHNSQANTMVGLTMCYEIFNDSDKLLETTKALRKQTVVKESDDHFLVKLNAKPIKSQLEFSQYSNTLRKFSLELLRSILAHNESLVTFANLNGFIPLMEQSLRSDNEGLLIASMKVLNLVLLLPLDEDATKRLTVCTRRVLQMFKNSPSTNSDLAQACLRYLSSVVRHKNDDIDLKTSAIVYILIKLSPDLEDPSRQGLAFNFLKAVLAQHVMVPEVYDIMEKVSKIMVTNHTREIRNMARSTYFQFLMEYDQGKGKLEKEFQFLLGNLSYPAESGRLSVLELINSVILKATLELVQKISGSFFVGLSNVSVTDDSLKCRESATNILIALMTKLGGSNCQNIELYLISWMKQTSNNLLLRCGLQIYKLYISALGLNNNNELDSLFLTRLADILAVDEDGDDDDNDGDEWELIYASLGVFNKVVSVVKTSALTETKYEKYWKFVISLLLYPHSWVRLSASRLAGVMVSNLPKAKFLTDQDIQIIAHRSIRQLGAPKITEELGTQVVKNIVHIMMCWEKNDTKYIKKKDDEVYKYPVEWLVHKASGIIKNDYNSGQFVQSKKSAIKLAAMIVQVISADKLRMETVGQAMALALFNYTDEEPDINDEDAMMLSELANECLKIVETKLGMSEYTKMMAKVRVLVTNRRVERKVRRSQMKVINPEAAAKRKMKKHTRFREKRKSEKDDSGYYHGKKKQRR
ncbi:Utp20 protein [Saccharomycopsis crataegensis]|uniref:Utp20 protein n=1 Tax=Saccharomycopsis crataegensis TaxID=43959 RepID=A0AAV5QLW1_9ASCO|nr:Utp20 protein [Saccharomycopsis crataegensis]